MARQGAIPTFSEVLTDPRYADFARLLIDLNKKWKPNPGQMMAGNAVFNDNARRVFIECGRKFGKTDWAIDTCWRLGNMIRNGQGYYFAAFQKAVREIIWAPRRLQDWGPQDRILAINSTEMRVTFKTGTFVKADGADEFRFSKGFNPDFVVLDEFADYSQAFWQAMSPNFAAKDCIVIIISSPPWLLEDEEGNPVLFVMLADMWARYQREAERLGQKSKYFYLNLPTRYNEANLPPGFLEQEKKDLTEMGQLWLYEREYEAKRVVGGGERIIPTFTRDCVLPHEELMKRVQGREMSLDWCDAVDPSHTLFGCLLMATDPITKEVFFLDELVEKHDMDVLEKDLWPRIQALEDEVFPTSISPNKDRFIRVCDEAAKWWIVGCSADKDIDVHFQPTEKATNDIMFGCSILRFIFKYGKGFVSDRCKTFIWQMENWRRTSLGKIPDKKKDLIDCARYGLHALAYVGSEDELKEISKDHPRAQRRDRAQSVEELAAESEEEGLEDTTLEDYQNDAVYNEEEEWPFP